MAKGILWLVPACGGESLPIGRYNPAAHLHITLQFNVEQSHYVSYIGRTVNVVLESLCWDSEIEAIKVAILDDVSKLCSNRYPHITLSHKEGIKPFQSNAMLASEHKLIMLTDPKVGSHRVIPMRVEFHQFG